MHGGDIYNNEIKYDFSVNVNPYGPYEEVVDAVKSAVNNLAVYPEYESDELKNILSDYHDIDAECICITNGASEAINKLIGNQYVRDVIIETPSFFGYEKSLNPEQQLHTYTRNSFLKLNENLIPNGSILVIGNPANPSGEYTDSFIIDSLYKRVKASNAILLVDESFLPLSDYSENSLIKEIKNNKEYYDHMVVVRSFTKTFAIPALRLGYFVSSNEKLVSTIQNSLPEWNISLLAQVAGIECMKQYKKIHADYLNIKKQRTYLTKALKELGFLVCDSHSNYLLFTAPRDLYDKLLLRKILIRDCSDYRGIDEVVEQLQCKSISMDSKASFGQNDGVFRIAVRKEEDNEILVNILNEIINN